MKNFHLPLFLLTGVLVFSASLAFINLSTKSLILCIILTCYLFSKTLDIHQLGKIYYRFRYLFFSIVLLNAVFSSNNLFIALDKTLLLLLMLAVVNAYLQIQNTQDIISALTVLLSPLRVFGINTNRSAQLIGATINFVEHLQSLQVNVARPTELDNPDPESANSRLNQLINRLAHWIISIEKNALDVDKLDCPTANIEFNNL